LSGEVHHPLALLICLRHRASPNAADPLESDAGRNAHGRKEAGGHQWRTPKSAATVNDNVRALREDVRKATEEFRGISARRWDAVIGNWKRQKSHSLLLDDSGFVSKIKIIFLALFQ
jgi:hypothetical protein